MGLKLKQSIWRVHLNSVSCMARISVVKKLINKYYLMFTHIGRLPEIFAITSITKAGSVWTKKETVWFMNLLLRRVPVGYHKQPSKIKRKYT